MIHIDPASAEFEHLPRHEQARLYRAMGWTVSALMEEFSVARTTIQRWTNPVVRERDVARKAAYRQSAHGQQVRRDCEKRYQQSGRRSAVRKSMDAIA